jgi:two-component system NtrC family sensor kinase
MSEPLRILFIDDEENILRALERVFFDDDYEILTAGSADEALQVLSRVSPVQVVVSDYRMPLMNGVELLRTVRAQWPETVRAVLSGYADTAAIVSAINDGQIYRFIPKPWDDTDLRMTIAAAAEQYKRQRKEILYAESMHKKIDELERENSFLVRCIAASIHGITPQEILDNLPAGVVVLDEKSNNVTCNHEARSLLMAHADNGRYDTNDLHVPESLLEFLSNDTLTCAKGKRMFFGHSAVFVRATGIESRGGKVLVAVLVKETRDD